MRRTLVASEEQIVRAGKLIDRLGASAYRDAKRAAGLKWDEPFGRLYRLDAETVLGIMEEGKTK